MSTHLRRFHRHDSGFWTVPPVLERPRKPFVLSRFGVKIILDRGSNTLRDRELRYCENAAHVIDSSDSSKLLGFVQFATLENSGTRLKDPEYVYRLNENAHPAYDLCARLLQFFSISNLFDHGRSIVELKRLELLPGSHLQGLGCAVGLSMLKILERKLRASLFFLEPFPLQYQRTPQVAAQDSGKKDDGFMVASKKLRELYANEWGAMDLDGQYMFCSFANVFIFDEHRRTWVNVGRRHSRL